MEAETTIEKFKMELCKRKDITLKNVETDELIKRTAVFSRMVKDDLPAMCKIHNEAWEADKYPSLRLELEHFQSQFSHFPGLGGYILDESEKGEAKNLIPIIGISPVRINSKLELEAGQPKRWKINSKDSIPLSWNACTNYGTFDSSTLAGSKSKKVDRIWPDPNGDTIVCPTVYTKKIVEIEGRIYKVMTSVMEEIINSIVKVAREISQNEKRDIKIAAYSTPKNFAEQRKEYEARGVRNLSIEEYLVSTISPKYIITYEDYFKKHDEATEEDWIKELYGTVYLKSKGIVIYNEFKHRVLEFMTMETGRKAYRLYKEIYGPIDIEQFVHETGRFLLDSVIGRHIKYGAKIGKILPNGREDPTACNYNIYMRYLTIKYKEVVEELPKSTETKNSTVI